MPKYECTQELLISHRLILVIEADNEDEARIKFEEICDNTKLEDYDTDTQDIDIIISESN